MPRRDGAEAVHRIELGNEEFEGRNNAYLIDGSGPTVLVDTGIAIPAVRADFEAGLSAHGVRMSDIDVVLLTHWHPDHSGLAGIVQAASDATVFAHEADAPVIAREGAVWEEMLDLIESRFDEWGVPREKGEELLAVYDAPELQDIPRPTVDPLVDGDEIAAGACTLRVRHVPGHTAGLVAFDIVGTSEAFVGDAVLPEYTPNVGGADLRVDRPLATYLDTLERLEAAGYERLYPGHRAPIDSPGARIRRILTHHHERTRRVVEVLDEEGPGTPWEVSARLFGDLEGIHIMHGPGEAYAHLDFLEERGAVTAVGTTYHLAVDPGEATAGV